METLGPFKRDIWGYIKVIILGLYRDNGKENGNYRDYRVYLGVYIGFLEDTSCGHSM